MPDAGALARRRPRLADLPARPLLGLLAVTQKTGPRSAIVLRPDGDRVWAESSSGPLAAAVLMTGDLTRPLAIPRDAIALLQRRHPDAERLAIEGAAPGEMGGLLLRTLSSASAVSVIAAERPVPDGPSVADLIRGIEGQGGGAAALLDLQLLTAAADCVRRICGTGMADLQLVDHPVLGLLVRGQPSDDLIRLAVVAVARCVPCNAV